MVEELTRGLHSFQSRPLVLGVHHHASEQMVSCQGRISRGVSSIDTACACLGLSECVMTVRDHYDLIDEELKNPLNICKIEVCAGKSEFSVTEVSATAKHSCGETC